MDIFHCVWFANVAFRVRVDLHEPEYRWSIVQMVDFEPSPALCKWPGVDEIKNLNHNVDSKNGRKERAKFYGEVLEIRRTVLSHVGHCSWSHGK